MSTPPSPKLVAPGEGRQLALYGVKFGYKVESADSGGSPAGLETYFEELSKVLTQHQGDAPRYYELAQQYGITIMDEWIEELEKTYGIKL